MRLAEFILRNMETILEEWESFAATLLPAAADMSSALDCILCVRLPGRMMAR